MHNQTIEIYICRNIFIQSPLKIIPLFDCLCSYNLFYYTQTYLYIIINKYKIWAVLSRFLLGDTV